MGFGAMFLGFMFLYDFQLALHHTGTEQAYAVLDIFPDAVGWLLLFFGLRSLTKKVKGFALPYRLTVVFFVLSLFTLAKDTLLFSFFYVDNVQIFAGEAIDFLVHLGELAFIILLFRETPALCRKHGEDKLARSHETVPRLASAEGFVFLMARLLRLLPLPESFFMMRNVISVLDLIFIVSLVWYGTLVLFRTMMHISD